MNSAEIVPSLLLCFANGSRGAARRIKIPRDGLVIGRECAQLTPAVRDHQLAPRHAEIRVERGGRAVIRDLGSAAGTRVNGEYVTGTQPLEPGDVVRVGDTLFLYTKCAEMREDAEPGLLGDSDAMLAVQRSVQMVAARKHTVVITGETGTGKEVVARLIHERSGRTGPFVAVNCSTFTEAMLPSELFGHVKGAFTGAVNENPGLFRAARGGTLLLDEMADIPLALQASLLRVLETQEVRPVGGTKDIPIDVRVIATINREIVELVQAGKFRADLYARLAQWTVRLPKLNARREDIPVLVQRMLPRVEGAGRKLSPDLAEALLVHDWPLNVRGLMNVLSIAVISTEDTTAPLMLTPEVQMALWTTRSMTSDPTESVSPEPVRTTLDKAELEELMERFQGHVANAGRHVGMTRSKLYRLLEAHGMDPGEYRNPAPGGAQGGQPGAREEQLNRQVDVAADKAWTYTAANATTPQRTLQRSY